MGEIKNKVVNIKGAETKARFGSSGGAGNIDGNRKVDLAISASSYLDDTGRVYLYLNNWSNSTNYTADNADVIITGEGVKNYFGNNVIIKDVMGSSLDDIIVTAYGTDRVYVFAGRNDWSDQKEFSAVDADLIITCGDKRIYFGYAIVVANTMGDWRNDITISAPSYANKGNVWNIMGREEWGGLFDVRTNSNVSTIIGARSNDLTGNALAAVCKQNGHCSLAIGAPGALAAKGVIYVLFFDMRGNIYLISFSKEFGFKIIGINDNDQLGNTLTSGNMDLGNADALIATAIGAHSYTGTISIIFIDGLTEDIYLKDSHMPLVLFIEGTGLGAKCGYSMGVIKNFYGDSIDTLVTSCPFDSGGTGAGFLIKAREKWASVLSLSNPTAYGITKLPTAQPGDYFAKFLVGIDNLSDVIGGFFAGLQDSNNGVGMASIYFAYQDTPSPSSTGDGNQDSSSHTPFLETPLGIAISSIGGLASLATVITAIYRFHKFLHENQCCCYDKSSLVSSIGDVPLLGAEVIQF